MPPKDPKDSSASGRPSRSSRPPTRLSTPVTTPTASKHTFAPTTKSAPGSVRQPDDWSEPPMATPKASYREYDDRAMMNTSTQHMQPLGELPTAKMLEATKRPYPHQQTKKKGRNAAGTGGAGSSSRPANGTVGTSSSRPAQVPAKIIRPKFDAPVNPAPIPPAPSASSAPSAPPSSVPQAPSPALVPTLPPIVPQTVPPTLPPMYPTLPQAYSTYSGYLVSSPIPTAAPTPTPAPGLSQSPVANPSTPTAPRSFSGHPPASIWTNGNAPNSRTPQGRQRLSMVVDAAIGRSSQVGNVELGRAIKKLYEESLTNELLADLLDAVLAQKATADQIHMFQNYVKNARDPNAPVATYTNGTVVSNTQPPPAPIGIPIAPAPSLAPPPVTVPPPMTPAASTAGVQSKQVEQVEMNGSLSTGGNIGKKIIKRVKRGSKVRKELKERRVRREKRDKKKNGVKTYADRGEDSESDLTSVSSEMLDGPLQPPPEPSEPSSPQAPQFQAINSVKRKDANESGRPTKKQRIPSYEEVKRESAIRSAPPAGVPPRSARNPRKRVRSPSVVETPPPIPSGPPSVTSSAAGPSSSSSFGATQVVPAQPPSKKRTKNNKIKISPNKKTIQEPAMVTAGIVESNEHKRPARFGSEEISENEDTCAVCNGPGRFLCCERCPKSFHFSCLNPPLEDIPDGTWFCNRCTAQHHPPPKPPKGLFSELIDNINRRNPTSFKLPALIRNYFVGVETGNLGEYVDARDSKTQRYKYIKNGFVEEYDTHKLKDKSGNPILCHHCGKSAIDGQRIISCDFCPLSWHLDCIMPVPMSNPPPTQKKWMCPAHAHGLQPRRPKNATIVDVHLRRGFKNNGVIEIENEEEPQYVERDLDGVVYRLPERGIKLDFIEKVKMGLKIRQDRQNSLQARSTTIPTPVTPVSPIQTPRRNSVTPPPPGTEDLSRSEQQLVQYLLDFASHERNSGGLIKPLIDTLLNEATTEVKMLLARTQGSSWNSEFSTLNSRGLSPEAEKDLLVRLQELIARRLRSLAVSTHTEPPTVPTRTGPRIA